MPDPIVARESRPSNPSVFGKRTAAVKTTVDPDTKLLLEAKARALGYPTLAEFLADVLTANARGVFMVKSVMNDRIERAVRIGPELGESDPEGGGA